ncbi:hypothetical protein QCA50_007226 [Cerrena zonata]|uniref:Uncharacterized protein n=1 Tax=Cerrena zonata TaxID=2478898 RepID=A0AAW0GDJ8_9APHY
MDPFIATDAELVRLQASMGAYDYIIVGGGFAGALLAEELVKKQKKVLLIEKGVPTFSTHICNTARPSFARGEDDSPEGNETIYNKLKSWVQLADGSDQDYGGGPLICLGGRSLVWGLWIPRSSPEVLSAKFPPQVANEIQATYYQKAFNIVTNGSQQNDIYPRGSPGFNATSVATTLSEVTAAVQDWIAPGHKLDLGPLATELVSSSPYQFPQGAFSTIEAILNRIYARDPYLTVLMGADVLSLELSKPNENNKQAKTLTFRMMSDQSVYTIPTDNSKVILSAGTIPTAQIALRSGLRAHNPLVGKGLIDHAIYAVRFAREAAHSSKDPVLLQTYVDLFKNIPGVGPTRALLTVTVNNNFFLAGKTTVPISQYMTRDGGTIAPTQGKAAMAAPANDFDTIAVLIEFGADLDDYNEVVNIPAPHPVIRMKRHQTHASEEEQIEMQNLATRVRNTVIKDVLESNTSTSVGVTPTPGNTLPQVPDANTPSPRLTLLPSGIFAHEVGTMRMPKADGTGGVVDQNLLVHGFNNLYACDSSVLPYSVEANPALTLSAVTMRFADHLTGIDTSATTTTTTAATTTTTTAATTTTPRV